MSETTFRAAVAALAAAALALRLAHAQAVLALPFGDVLVQDARVYWETAQRLLGALPPLPGAGGPSFMNVGYPWLLAALVAVFGASVRVVLVAQGVLGAGACALVALAARSFTGRKSAGLLAGGAALLYAPALFYDGLLLTPAPTFACAAGALWALAAHRRAPGLLPALLAGASLTVPVLLRANAVLFVPVAAAALAAAAPRGVRVRQAAALLAAALLLPAGAVVHGRLAHGAWLPLSANAGMNLWVGNHRGATGVYVAAPFLEDGGAEAEEAAFHDEARRRAGDPWMTLAASSSYWRREAFREAASDPGRAVRLLARKSVLFFTDFEVKTNYALEFSARRSPALRILPLGFGLAAAAGGMGIALLLSGRPAVGGLLAAWVAVPWLTCAVFFVSGEYRHAAAPALLIGAGALPGAFREAKGRARLAALAVGALVGTAAAWPRPELAQAFAPELDVRAHVRSLLSPSPGAPLPGPAEVERALAMVSGGGEHDLVVRDTRLWIRVRAARLLGRREDARAALEDAAAILARDLRPGRGTPPESFLRYLASAVPARLRELAATPVVQRDPALRRVAERLGADGWAAARAASDRGDVAGAVALLREAVAALPGDPRPRAELGRALLAAGRRAEGLARLRESCLGWPEIPQCAYYVAEAYAREGNLAQARRAATLALVRDPAFAPAAALLHEVDAPGPIGHTPTP